MLPVEARCKFRTQYVLLAMVLLLRLKIFSPAHQHWVDLLFSSIDIWCRLLVQYWINGRLRHSIERCICCWHVVERCTLVVINIRSNVVML